MYGKKVKLRFLFIFFIFLSLILSVFLILKSLEENVVYFQSPSDIQLLEEIKKTDSTKEDNTRITNKNLNLTFRPYMD